MEQRIEAPNDTDIDAIARMLVHAESLIKEISGSELQGGKSDLRLIQAVLDSKSIQREATYQLQALGIAFGKVFVNENDHYDWWMVEDEYGRDPAVRYKETSLLIFPQTMISKRIEDDGQVDVAGMYSGLLDSLESVIDENYRDA